MCSHGTQLPASWIGLLKLRDLISSAIVILKGGVACRYSWYALMSSLVVWFCEARGRCEALMFVCCTPRKPLLTLLPSNTSSLSLLFCRSRSPSISLPEYSADSGKC